MPHPSHTTIDLDAMRARLQPQPERDPGLQQAISELPTLGPLAMQAESTAVQPREGGPGTIVGAIREMRDGLIARAADNPLQRMVARPLGAIGQMLDETPVPGGLSVLDVLENVGKGAALGSVVIPDDAAIDPSTPVAGLQIAGMFAGGAAEGLSVDFGILKGLKFASATAKARAMPNLQRSVDQALTLFGQGENASTLKQAMGGAALGATSELALQTAALNSPEQILGNAALVGVGGAALGGAIAGAGMGARKLIGKGPQGTVAETVSRGSTAEEQILPRVETPNAVGRVDPQEAGLQAGVNVEQRAQLGEVDLQAARVADTNQNTLVRADIDGTTNNKEFEEIFEANAGPSFAQGLQAWLAVTRRNITERFAKTFEYESALKPFPGLDGLDEVTLADDIRFLQHGIQRASTQAQANIEFVLEPFMELKGKQKQVAYNQFVRLVVGRDLIETAQKGLKLPNKINPVQLAEDLQLLEYTAGKQVQLAASRHRQFVGEMRDGLISRGKLGAGDGYENYYPHQIIDDLANDDAVLTGVRDKFVSPTQDAIIRARIKEPSRPYTRRREGSDKFINTDYIETMFRAARRYHSDNAITDFLGEVRKSSYNLKRTDLTPDELRALDRTTKGFVRDGVRYRLFRPSGPGYYRTHAVNDEAYETLLAKVNEGLDITAEDVPVLREVFAASKPDEMILPAALAERMEQFYTPDPLRGTLLSPLQRANARWKRNTIWWGLSRFFVFQVLGDSVNLARSNPAAFLQVRNGRLDSPVLRAVNEIAKKYQLPLSSKQQVVRALGSGLAGATINELRTSEDQSNTTRLASFLAGAGLGYISGSYRMLGTRQTGSAMYDLADELAVINSGITAQSEDLATRILGGHSNIRGITQRNAWQRSLDTVTTLAFGKAQGDPMAFARVPAEIIGAVQVERENWLRLASFMQMIEKGVDPKVASRRASRALVDYGQFTEFENKILRGFLLPFYAFYRHNIPNWIKAVVGKDVGGKVRVAQAAVGAIAAGDIAAQVWNETFFPEVERGLPEWQRRQFHIIMGNPVTGQPYSDVKGKVMLFGLEMPYEQALEFMGLARPGYLYSQLFGIAGEFEDPDLGERAKLMAQDVVKLRGAQQQVMDLLSPAVKLPIELVTNKNLFANTPIVAERYLETPEQKAGMRKHVAQTLFRQVREVDRLLSDVQGRRFDPLSSAFGLGLPFRRTRPSQQWQGFIHEQMDEVQLEFKKIDAAWKRKIDDLLYEREDFGQIAPDEGVRISEILRELPESEQRQAQDYYMTRGGMGSLMRRFQSLSVEERVKLLDTLHKKFPPAFTYLVGALNGGPEFDKLIDEQYGRVPSLLGG